MVWVIITTLHNLVDLRKLSSITCITYATYESLIKTFNINLLFHTRNEHQPPGWKSGFWPTVDPNHLFTQTFQLNILHLPLVLKNYSTGLFSSALNYDAKELPCVLKTEANGSWPYHVWRLGNENGLWKYDLYFPHQQGDENDVRLKKLSLHFSSNQQLCFLFSVV